MGTDKKGVAEFSPLNVSMGKMTTEQEALEKTGATSSRTTDENLQSLDATIRSMPGTYTQIDPGQGAVSVNIRGMSGFGRVNTMVDGITQSFYGSTTSGTTVHGSTNNMAGVLIDPNFLVAVDVTRGDSSGAAGVNALTGSANMRTIGVDDVIFNGNTYGLRSRFSVGSNGLGRSGMLAVGGKNNAFTDTGKARRLSPDFEQDEHTGAIIKKDLPQIPTIIDLYGTYEVNRNLTLKLSVQNLMDKDYSEALNKLNMMPGLGDETHPANSARGRTWLFGVDYRF